MAYDHSKLTSAQAIERRKHYLKRLGALSNERSSWEPTWKELATYIDPWRGRFCTNERNDGKRKDRAIVDTTAQFALRTMQSGFMAGHTSPSKPWFRLSIRDSRTMESRGVREWLGVVEELIRDVLAKSNFYSALHNLYGDLGLFGTAAMLCMDDDERVVRFYPYPVGSFWAACNDKLEVDTIYRKVMLTVRQVVSKFGIECCSDSVKAMYANGNLDSTVEILHVIEPNEGKIHGKLGDFAYRSCWMETAGIGLLREDGYKELPVFVARWDVNGEDVYGHSPGMIALGDTKALQVQQRRKAQAIDKHVDPPMVADPSLRHQKTSLVPGDVTFIPGGASGVGFTPAYVIKPEITALMADNNELRGRINSAFFANLFLMISMDDRGQPPTAQEVIERRSEKMLMLGPVLERLDSELYDKVIDRVFAIMVRKQLLPPAPQALQGQPLKVEYISVLAQAQKMTGLQSIDRTIAFIANAAQFNPTALDKLDIDQAIDEYATMLGTPATIIRNDEDVAAMRESRAQEQAAQAAMQQIPQVAESMSAAARNLSQSDTDRPSMLKQLMGAANGG